MGIILGDGVSKKEKKNVGDCGVVIPHKKGGLNEKKGTWMKKKGDVPMGLKEESSAYIIDLCRQAKKKRRYMAELKRFKKNWSAYCSICPMFLVLAYSQTL